MRRWLALLSLTATLCFFTVWSPAWAISAYRGEAYNYSNSTYNGAKAYIFTPNHSMSVPSRTIKAVVRGPEIMYTDWLPGSPWQTGLAEIGWYWCYPRATPWAYFTSCNGNGDMVISDYSDLGYNQYFLYETVLQGDWEPYYYYINGNYVGKYDVPMGYIYNPYPVNGEVCMWKSTSFRWHCGGRQSTSDLKMQSWISGFALRKASTGVYRNNWAYLSDVTSPFSITWQDPANFETKANWPY